MASLDCRPPAWGSARPPRAGTRVVPIEEHKMIKQLRALGASARAIARLYGVADITIIRASKRPCYNMPVEDLAIVRDLLRAGYTHAPGADLDEAISRYRADHHR